MKNFEVELTLHFEMSAQSEKRAADDLLGIANGTEGDNTNPTGTGGLLVGAKTTPVRSSEGSESQREEATREGTPRGPAPAPVMQPQESRYEIRPQYQPPQGYQPQGYYVQQPQPQGFDPCGGCNRKLHVRC